MMILYVKNGCPWCVIAESWLKRHGVVYKAVDVLQSPEDFNTMRAISGQSKAPVLVSPEGKVLSDFGPEELPGFFGITED